MQQLYITDSNLLQQRLYKQETHITSSQPKMPPTQNEIGTKAQPWKAFFAVTAEESCQKMEDTPNSMGSIRLRTEADDKGSLGG